MVAAAVTKSAGALPLVSYLKNVVFEHSFHPVTVVSVAERETATISTTHSNNLSSGPVLPPAHAL